MPNCTERRIMWSRTIGMFCGKTCRALTNPIPTPWISTRCSSSSGTSTENVNGEDVTSSKPVYFQVMQQTHGSRRAKVVQAPFDGDEDIAMRSPLALGVNFLNGWRRSSDLSFTWFYDSGPTVISLLDIASWATLKTGLPVCESRVFDTLACMDFSNTRQARPIIALTDYNCPTLMLLERVQELYFIPARCQVDPNPATTMKIQTTVPAQTFLFASSIFGFKPMYFTLRVRRSILSALICSL